MKKKLFEPIIIKPPKKRIPNAPPEKVLRTPKEEAKRMPSGRLAKHKKKDSATER